MQIGVSAPILAENFNAIVHAAAARPAVFNQSYGAIGELQDAQRIVFGFGLVAVNVGAHLAVDRLDWRAAEEPIAKRDTVAAQVHQCATAGAIHVPKPRAVRPEMLFALFDQIDLAKCAGIRHFLGF